MLTQSQKTIIAELRMSGNGYKKIAKMLGKSRDEVRQYCRGNNLLGLRGYAHLPETKKTKHVSDRCDYCGKEINHQESKIGRPSRFCGDKCRRSWWAENPNKKNKNDKAIYKHTCLYCGCLFEAYGNNNRKYCSKECAGLASQSLKNQVKECPVCKNKFTPKTSNQRYCGIDCVKEKRRIRADELRESKGVNADRHERKLRVSNWRYAQWRTDVFERDEYTCQCCGDKKGKNLNAHHLFSYSDNKEVRLDADNGITLCIACHTYFHRLFGYGGNTKGQFLKFKRVVI